ncbi:MAG: carboxypeptidase-like regulatory domain-containing protein, partial [Nakamurella sp.]
MRVFLTPDRVELADGNTVEINVTVHNTGSLIGGYHLRILGADPSWVTLQTENLSLFPDAAETVRAVIRIPPGVAAGERRMAVQVRELTPPQAIAIEEIELVVPAVEAVRATLTPMTVVGGKVGTFGVVLENTGNTPIVAELAGTDAEDVMRFDFEPPVLSLAPGDQAIADLRASGPRRWFGSPVVRTFGVFLRPNDRPADADQQPADQAIPAIPTVPAAGSLPAPVAGATAIPAAIAPAMPAAELAVPGSDRARADQAGPTPGTNPAANPDLTPADPVPPPEPLVTGTLLQKARLSRGALSLLSLLFAATVFATVITIALSALVGQSAADRNLAIQIAAARNSDALAGSSSLGGTVVLLTSGQPVAGVSVELFSTQEVATPLANTATAADGSWQIGNLPAGSYKVRVRGAGFAEIWYDNALTAADAKDITLQVGQQIGDLQVTLGGLPASVSGEVIGADVAGAVLTVQVPVEFLPADPPAVADQAAAASAQAQDGAVLRTVPIGSDGLFEISDIASPAVYDLVVSKTGFATESQRVDLSGGESRTGVQLRLRTGDGLISGTVTGPDGPLGGAIVSATTGTTTVQTVSLTEGTIGAFTLRGLVTPATYTVTASSPGYSSQTTSVSLAEGQKLTGDQLSLSRSSGSLSGVVTTLPGNVPAAGVTVTVSTGTTTVQTVTQSTGNVGSWTIAGLPIPSPDTITFSRPDLESQTVAVALDAAGNLSSGSAGAGVGPGGITVAMTSAFAQISGVVSQRDPSGSTQPVGEAAVTLSSGADTYTVTSASEPASAIGSYQVGGVVPGTYTLSVNRRGTTPTSVIVTVVAGQALVYNPVLIPPASITGTVTDQQGNPQGGLEVSLFRSSDYPAQATQRTTTNAAGVYTFADVDAPQAYVLEVRSSTLGALGSATLVLAASQPAVLDIKIGGSPPAATLPSVPAPAPPAHGAPAPPAGAAPP